MSWRQRFDRCCDKLMLRVGGPGGPLIHWPDRGMGGQCTWSWQDPAGEVRDISPWVGDSPVIRLYALVLETGATGQREAQMTTLYRERACKRWLLDEDEDQEVKR